MDATRKTIADRLTSVVKTYAAASFHSFKDGGFKPLRSTPLKATGYFDGRAIVGTPTSLVWVVAAIADKIASELEQPSGVLHEILGKRQLRFLAVSRSGIALTAGLNWLVRSVQGMAFVDHFGPWQEVMEEHLDLNASRDVAYIYVGDFIIAGTEARVAQAYARSCNSDIVLATAIGAALPTEHYGFPFKLLTLVPPLPELVPAAKFRFGD